MMKKSYLFGILIIAACVMIIIATAGDASTYVSFHEAHQIAADGHQNNKVHVVGHLKKSTDGEIIGLEPSEDKLSFSFVMVDEQHQEQKVYYKEPMPADFTRSEQVVVVGSYHDNVFVADQILMKCPSKYQEQEIG